ncbi:protein Dr1 isoform X1 [Hydra vulgaris]|uniref:protein Dr1 isoform X1 n=1 Tax=Hydra vulgaris TaxID=6087 RepID=UPI001F5F7F19|nr:protein Dr1 isoform X1 [Hydra vulgaris]
MLFLDCSTRNTVQVPCKVQLKTIMADSSASSAAGPSSQQPEDDLSLPRAAVNKMIKEMVPFIRVSNDARELVLNCCTEFIHLIASEANEICNKQTKKTISPEHVIAALESLGFQSYIQDVEGVYQQFKTQAQTRKKNNKLKNLGVSEEELLRQQQALIAQARAEQAQEEWVHLQQQCFLPTSSGAGTVQMQNMHTLQVHSENGINSIGQHSSMDYTHCLDKSMNNSFVSNDSNENVHALQNGLNHSDPLGNT